MCQTSSIVCWYSSEISDSNVNYRKSQWNGQTIKDVCFCCWFLVCCADQNHDVNDQNISIAAKIAYDIVKCDAPFLSYVGLDFKFSMRPLNKITLVSVSRMKYKNGRFAMNISDRENPDRFSIARPVAAEISMRNIEWVLQNGKRGSQSINIIIQTCCFRSILVYFDHCFLNCFWYTQVFWFC